MARQAYHITEGSPDAGYIKIAPQTWYNVGAVQSVGLSIQSSVSKALLVNTAEEIPSALGLRFSDEMVLEDEGRILYVYGEEGHYVITDDGA